MSNRNKKNQTEITTYKLEKEIEIYRILIDISDAFNPPLKVKISNLSEYASKLYEHAEVYSINDSSLLGFIAFYANDTLSKITYITLIAVQLFLA